MPVAGNDNLKAVGTEQKYTPEELKELFTCSTDIEYFSENYCTIVTLDGGKQLIKLRQYQKDLLHLLTGETVVDEKYNAIILAPRQSGKCCSGSTLIRVKHKKTGEIMELPIGKFHEMIKNSTVYSL